MPSLHKFSTTDFTVSLHIIIIVLRPKNEDEERINQALITQIENKQKQGSFMCNDLVNGPTNVASFSHIPCLVLLGSYPKSRAKVSICSLA